MAVLSIDLGENTGTGIVYEYDGGRIVLTEVHKFNYSPIFENNVYKWGIAGIYNEVLQCIRAAAEKKFKLESIAVDSWGMDYAYLDLNGNIVNNPVYFYDMRTNDIYRKFPSLSIQELYTKTGMAYNASSTIFQFAADNGLYNYEGIKTFLYISDIINYLLTGHICTDKTLASTSGFFNKIDGFKTEFLKSLNIPETVVPSVETGYQPLGEIKAHILKELNICDPIKVMVGGGLNDACAISCFKKGDAVLISGTFNKVGTVIDNPIISQCGFASMFSNESGLTGYNFVKKFCGTNIIDNCLKEWERFGKVYDEAMVKKMIDSVKPFSLLMDVSSRIFSLSNTMPQKIMALSGARTDAEILRAAYDSTLLENKYVLSEMEVLLGKKFNRVHFTGPLSNYNEYCKSLSNILGIEVGANKYDASSFGNAINQFIYLKRFENHVRSSEFLRLNFQEKIYIPEESEKVECESAYKRYLMLKKTR